MLNLSIFGREKFLHACFISAVRSSSNVYATVPKKTKKLSSTHALFFTCFISVTLSFLKSLKVPYHSILTTLKLTHVYINVHFTKSV